MFSGTSAPAHRGKGRPSSIRHRIDLGRGEGRCDGERRKDLANPLFQKELGQKLHGHSARGVFGLEFTAPYVGTHLYDDP